MNIVYQCCNYLSYAPRIVSVVRCIDDLRMNAYAYFNWLGDLEETDQKVQDVFYEIVEECGLNKDNYFCKIDSSSDCLKHVAYAKGWNTVAISKPIADNLIGLNRKKCLFARGVIKHELGHLYNRDSASDIGASAVRAALLFSAYKIANLYFPFSEPTSFLESLVWSGAFLVTTCAQFAFITKARWYKDRRDELGADAFSIRHGHVKELHAMADDYESFIDKAVESAHIKYVSQQLFGKSIRIIDLYEARENRAQTLKEWIIQNRYTYNMLTDSHIHPNPYDRANTFRQAALLKESSKDKRC